ncbi:MAG: nicotinate (nicotinamide) nucleotide adenylyltransferase [Gemmatimonadetes bacterium]|nr:nicotinate (nicotinamide) nucleotide adenylyltransferase [Gemmatimonadota bacterium]
MAGGPGRPEPASGTKRVGVFGGTFDPPHVGHLIVARDAAETLGLDGVVLVPAARPPHKTSTHATSADLRLAMVNATVADDPILSVLAIELARPGPSYTVDTLRQLKVENPAAELFLLIGADQWRQLGTWKEPEQIGVLATISVMAREGEDPETVDLGLGLTYQRVPVTRLDISSTEVRSRVREGRSIRYLVPRQVEEIIRSNQLYGA